MSGSPMASLDVLRSLCHESPSDNSTHRHIGASLYLGILEAAASTLRQHKCPGKSEISISMKARVKSLAFRGDQAPRNVRAEA